MSKDREKFFPGAKRPSTKSIDEELSFGKPKANPIKERFDSPKQENEDSRLKSLYVRDLQPDLIERIKNIVYTEKVNGNPFANQSAIVNQALSDYANNYKDPIIERPDFVKEQERRKSKK